jgi:hypothetical protein
MTEWKSADIVTTTYGTIKKAQQESFDEGAEQQRNEVIVTINEAITLRKENKNFDLLQFLEHFSLVLTNKGTK